MMILALIAVAELAFGGSGATQDKVSLSGNHPIADIQNWSAAPSDLQLHMTAVLSLRNTAQLETLKTQILQPGSPVYHQWLSSSEFASRFGPTPEQMQSVVAWLTSSGFSIESADLGTGEIHFSGAAAQVQHQLGTTIVSNGGQYANLNDPQIPTDLSGSIVAFFGLNNLGSASAPAPTPMATAALDVPQPHATATGSKQLHFSPQDFWLFYNEANPTTAGANGGTGAPDCIGLLEVATLPTVPSPLASPTPSVAGIFSSQFNLPAPQITITTTDSSVAPGQPGDNEPPLDVDWAHSVAPDTPIVLYVSTIPNSNSPAFDTLSLAVTQNVCGVISSSIDDTGSKCPDLALINAYAQKDSQAVMQGQTLFHSSGDYGSNYPCGQPNSTGGETGVQPSIEESSASSDVTVVGGTQFQPTYDPTTGANTSQLAPGFEQVWQAYSPGPQPTPLPVPAKGTSGGGISVVFAAPSWQQGLIPFGLTSPPAMRTVPDVSAAASADSPGYWIATTYNISNCPNGDLTCFIGDGGTSASSPIWAGISRLIAQSLGITRLGNINPMLYQLGKAGSPALVDVSVPGNNCTFNSCSQYPGYQVGPGYDLGTGWGSPNIQNLIAAFQPSPTPTAAPTSSPTTAPTATTSAAPTATGVVTPSATPIAPTATPLPPTPTPVPGAQASASAIVAGGTLGQTVAGGTLKVTNTTGSSETIQTVTVTLSNPVMFSNLTMSGSVNGGQAQVAVAPTLGAIVTFTFSPALSVPAGGVAQFTLSATLGNNTTLGAREVVYAGLMARNGARGAIPMGAGLGLLAVGLLAMPAGRRRRTILIAAWIMLMATATVGCGGGGSSSSRSVLNLSQQQVPAGGVGATNAQGAVGVLGLPANLSTIQLLG